MPEEPRTERSDSREKGLAPPTISLPRGGGAIRGIGEKFAANPVTGTGSVSVPLQISPGRSGFGPALSLSYDSGSGNGPFGFGWNLSIPSITRKTDKGLPQYRDAEESDVYILAGAEDLVPVLVEVSGQWLRVPITRTEESVEYNIHAYRPRTEGLFARIERWTNSKTGVIHWRSFTRENVITVYGKDDNSRICDPDDPDPGNPARIFSWLICESYDDRGNAIIYQYEAENTTGVELSQAHERNRTASGLASNRYLRRVKYGNRASRLTHSDPGIAGWMFEVVFDYGQHDPETPMPGDNGEWLCRHDPFSSYRAGFEVRTYRLCQRVLMFHHFPDEQDVGQDCLVGSTDLVYQDIRGNPDDLKLGHPVASFIASITQNGYRRNGAGYLKKSFPPVEFEYSRAVIQDDITEVDAESLENLPYGLDGVRHQWIDLDGEGVTGILSEEASAWFYKRNLGPISVHHENGIETRVARFAPAELVAHRPSPADAGGGQHQFLDLAGDGFIDLVQFQRPFSGFFERTAEGSWTNFTPFQSTPDLAWNDPNLKFVDLTGDGHADVIVAEDNAFTWYPSLAEGGFGASERVQQTLDEEKGPHLVFADGVQSVYLADMSGDGLTDLVRIRNGEVCYWPNLGYARFGAKVTMDNAPWLDAPELFDQRRIRVADIDGSGVADIIYLGCDGVRLYFNQSGNSWSEPRTLGQLPACDNLSSVMVVDLLGCGTACLVWSSPLPDSERRSMRYIDLMGAQKPHLLIGVKNNMGAETRVDYAPSTKFYLADKFAGNPWVTRLPFPVQVVERIETLDRISRNRFVTRFAYHHGYFDGLEREFRGFGMIEQWDTEEFASLNASASLSNASNIDSASHVPPVLTRTWFDTGASSEEGRISRQFEHEYWRESDATLGETGLTDAQMKAVLLADTVLPDAVTLPNGASIPREMTIEELPEAFRALKGSILHQEIYALDGSEEMDRPYTVSERNYTIEMLQPRGSRGHAVFFVHARESVEFQYERKLFDVGGQMLADPRVTHSMTLATDGFGNIKQSAVIGYGRRRDDPDPLLTDADRQKQKLAMITATDGYFTNLVQDDDAYRTPMACETRTYELINVKPASNQQDTTNLFGFEEMRGYIWAVSDGFHDIAYENVDAAGVPPNVPHRRLIENSRTLYRSDDLSTALPFGGLQSRALQFESYKLAFTAGQLSSVFQRQQQGQPPEDLLPDPAVVLQGEGGYVDLDGNGDWWIPTGRVFYHPDSGATPALELAFAREHFFLARRFQDPFLNNTTVFYDQSQNAEEYNLLVSTTLDAVGNEITAEHDYRVLQPRRVIDANGNRADAAFDVLGMVAATAVSGKTIEAVGDSLAGLDPDLDEATIIAHLQNPFDNPHDILKQATTRMLYDVHRYWRTRGTGNPQPNVVYALSRDTHDSDLPPGQLTRVLRNFSYSDGFAREIQRKVQAEPGPVITGGPAVSPRWVGSSWTIFNNKGKPVRQYEPFFSATPQFEFAQVEGVSPLVFYDPVQRVAGILHPNHTYEKVAFDPWQQQTWDMNDTVLRADPKQDPHIGDFFKRLPDADYSPTWHDQRASGALGAQEQSAAEKAAEHGNTPTIKYFDSLGRSFLTVTHNRFTLNGATTEEKYSTRSNIDIEGNHREVIDPKDRVAMKTDYDTAGRQIHLSSMEAGERWMLKDIAGKSILIWDSRGHRMRTTYDAIRRPLQTFVRESGGPESQIGKITYGEAIGNAQNHRGRIFQHLDTAGVVAIDSYDFKGNLLSLSRQFAIDHKNPPDWSSPVPLEAQTYTRSTTYDALNRPLASITPDDSVIRPTYNEASLVDHIEVNLRGAGDATIFVNDIGYNAKRQREFIEYGNGVVTSHEYDPLTYRLRLMQTRRGAECLQGLSYTYDPMGNITGILDGAQQTIFFNNQAVEPSAEYTYDAVYRLIQAEGREHIGQVSQPRTTWDDQFRVNLPHPNDGQAMRRYTERYEYDEVGNILSLIHKAVNGDWTRSYTYGEPSQIEQAKRSNRLSNSLVQGVTEPYAYDAHGNLLVMAHLPVLAWDFQNRLQKVDLSGGDTAYYVYDAGGLRVRKIIERPNGTRRRERVYFGGFEVYREYDGSGATVSLERETLPVMFGSASIALVETRTQGIDNSPAQIVRYQFNNHLGSASLELDGAGQIISYEEYYPYGCTSYQAVTGGVEADSKRYRYTGKERDEETGFYYHGARYYCSFLGRWISPDPGGMVDGSNLYAYVRNNPVMMLDPDGREADKIPIYWMVTLPAAARAAKEEHVPMKNAMLLLIWARGEQAPTSEDGSTPYNPNMHSGRLLNAQPLLKTEVASLCPDYAQKSCDVDKAEGDYKGAYIYNLKQLLTDDTKEKRGEQGFSAHFGFADTYSMFKHTLKRIAGETLKKQNAAGVWEEAKIPTPAFLKTVNRKLRDENMTAENFFNKDLDSWATPGYGQRFVTLKHTTNVPVEVRRWLPKVIKATEDAMVEQAARKAPLEAKRKALVDENTAILTKGDNLDATIALVNANRAIIAEYTEQLAYIDQIVATKKAELEALRDFQTAISPAKKK